VLRLEVEVGVVNLVAELGVARVEVFGKLFQRVVLLRLLLAGLGLLLLPFLLLLLGLVLLLAQLLLFERLGLRLRGGALRRGAE
jgi:hypothetical protein